MSRTRLLLDTPFLFHSVWLCCIVETFSLDTRCGTPLPGQASRCVGQWGLSFICMTLPWKPFTTCSVFKLELIGGVGKLSRLWWDRSLVLKKVFEFLHISLSSVTFIRVVPRIITVVSQCWIEWQVPISLILFDWVGPLLIWCSRWDRIFFSWCVSHTVLMITSKIDLGSCLLVTWTLLVVPHSLCLYFMLSLIRWETVRFEILIIFGGRITPGKDSLASDSLASHYCQWSISPCLEVRECRVSLRLGV